MNYFLEVDFAITEKAKSIVASREGVSDRIVNLKAAHRIK